MPLVEPLTDRVIGLAIEVHRHTGPGVGLLLNFNAPRLVDGLRRYVI